MKLLVICLFMLMSTGTFACLYDGQEYPVGTRIGPLVCTSDGSWNEQ
jgi:hypothetical protein